MATGNWARMQSENTFDSLTRALLNTPLRPEMRLTEIPAPTRIAPHAAAFAAEVLDRQADEELATGRLVVLHDPDCPEPWEGAWRIVTYADASLEPETGDDPMLGQVGWSWLTDALETEEAAAHALAGTATREVSESFGELESTTESVELQIRASWSPDLPDSPAPQDLVPHLRAWATLLCSMAGLPPLPEGVVALPGQCR